MALCATQNPMIVSGWRKNLWKWDLQQKVKLFLWLAANNKILTWQNLQWRGWEGPSRCHLCKNDSENTDHLFIHCPFTKSVWNKINSIKNYKQEWGGSNLDDSLSKWTKNRSASTSLAPLICWFVWLERNAMIFEEKTPSAQSVVI
jgi:hypothetical protein